MTFSATEERLAYLQSLYRRPFDVTSILKWRCQQRRGTVSVSKSAGVFRRNGDELTHFRPSVGFTTW